MLLDSAAVSKAEKRERQRENRERAREERARLIRRDKQKRAVIGLVVALALVAAVYGLFAVLKSDDEKKTATSTTTVPKPTYTTAPAQTIDPNKTYTATIETGEGTIVTLLDPKAAPVATNNFVFLARQGYYDGLPFHRAAKDFVIQGGDPKGDGSGGPGYTVVGEIPTDNYPEGSLAAAKGGAEPAGTMGSQFFIVTGSQGATLPNDYARFGLVTEGLDVAKKIEAFAPPEGDGTPTKKVLIKKITIAES